ncbi:MAG: SH3 domain-containing protein [Intestinibacter sp.]|uniref:C40 family peptidase n=1 Tax=Intestinibacter sp. TaxID=1965304 RepID=UPI002A81B215|nr:SH3 domain-containing protein [Intestinibacter sp.]MDY4575420.1 SH3 domain-containing protein [Intestinibacter sp.]
MKKVILALGVSAFAVSLNADKSYADSSAVVDVSALNVRSGPSLNYSKIGVVYRGSSLNVIETQGQWSHVELNNGSKGWVYSSYIKKSGSTSDNSTTYDTGVVNVSYVNVRSGAGNQYSVKTVASYGTKVTLLNKSGGWCNVKLSNGTTGWIYQKYIDFGKNSETNNNNNNTSNEFNSCNGKVTCYANLNVRSGPSTSYSIKTKLTYGQVVKLIDKSNGWYKVSLSNGITGWVKDDYIKITTEDVTNTGGSGNNSTSYRSAVVNLAYSLLGTPYAWGGNGPNYFDCSGFTRYVYLHAEGKSIPRVSYQQAEIGTFISRGNYLPGDLLYFATTGTGKTSHVGIYVGNNMFIHASGSASNPDKVKLSSLEGYYGRVLLGARRF